MPVSFKSLARSKQDFIAFDEENLEQGMIWSYTPSNVRTNFCGGFCWFAPSNGTAVIEIWGAGGSGGRMCCCGFGVPGNPGAYSRRAVEVASGCIINGTVGMSCGNADALCFRGCSEPTQLCWRGAGGIDGCMCAQGGRGGTSICSSGASGYCCFRASGFCVTGPFNDNCGIVCNIAPGSWIACAFGGESNMCGGFSCTTFLGCLPSCPCATQYHVATPPGKYSTEGTVVTFTTEGDSGATNWTGATLPPFLHGLGIAGRSPTHGIGPEHKCWTGGRTCGCYEEQGCSPFIPPGFPGLPATPCPDHRDSAYRGGHGLVRIKFIASGSTKYF
jgi:hypothetical protein